MLTLNDHALLALAQDCAAIAFRQDQIAVDLDGHPLRHELEQLEPHQLGRVRWFVAGALYACVKPLRPLQPAPATSPMPSIMPPIMPPCIRRQFPTLRERVLELAKAACMTLAILAVFFAAAYGASCTKEGNHARTISVDPRR
jgi:hypothetical protein